MAEQMEHADRARGLLVGLAVGDALGAPVEFLSPDAIAGRREELFGMPGGGVFDWAPGEFTDDTQMALVLARHLEAQGGAIDQQLLAEEFAAWARDAADVGNQTRSVLGRVTAGARWDEAIVVLPENAAGNGSLMRVAPVALVARDRAEAAVLAGWQSEVTHPNRSCRDACGVFASMLWDALHGEFPALDEVAARAGVDEVREAVTAAGEAGTRPPMSGWALHTLTGALWAVSGADTFADAVWRAVSLGEDADTVGAVAGALAGARWGMSAIPVELVAALQSQHPMFRGAYPDTLISLADALDAQRAR